MTEQEIYEALSCLEPMFCDHFNSVAESWKEGNFLEIGYIYQKWNNTVPEDNRVKVQKMVEFLKRAIDNGKIIIVD